MNTVYFFIESPTMEHPYYSKIPKLPLDKNLMMLLFLLAFIKSASMKVYPKALSTRVTRNHNNILYLMLNMKIFQIPFFHPLLASVISSIIIFKIQNGLVFLTKKSSSLSVQELYRLQDYEFCWFICANTNLDSIFKTP